jgi:hypothetical protein
MVYRHVTGLSHLDNLPAALSRFDHTAVKTFRIELTGGEEFASHDGRKRGMHVTE